MTTSLTTRYQQGTLYLFYHEKDTRWVIGPDYKAEIGLAFIDSPADTPCEIHTRSPKAQWFSVAGGSWGNAKMGTAYQRRAGHEFIKTEL